MYSRKYLTPTLSYQTNILLTAHCRLNAYQYRIKHVSSPLCSCLSEGESVEHFILRLPNFSSHQHEPLFCSVPRYRLTWPPELYVSIQSKQLLRALNVFMVKTHRLNNTWQMHDFTIIIQNTVLHTFLPFSTCILTHFPFFCFTPNMSIFTP